MNLQQTADEIADECQEKGEAVGVVKVLFDHLLVHLRVVRGILERDGATQGGMKAMSVDNMLLLHTYTIAWSTHPSRHSGLGSVAHSGRTSRKPTFDVVAKNAATTPRPVQNSRMRKYMRVSDNGELMRTRKYRTYMSAATKLEGDEKHDACRGLGVKIQVRAWWQNGRKAGRPDVKTVRQVTVSQA
jgi:hypothetical protein